MADRRRAWMLGLLWYFCSFAVWAQVAQVQTTQGDAWVAAPGGTAVPLVKGQDIAAGSELSTGDNGLAVVRFVDGHTIALKDRSSVKIANYQYNPQKPATSSMVLDLLRGGLRTLTGLLGKANPSAFKLRTPVATVGIRGTDATVALIDGDLFTRVDSGGIFVDAGGDLLLVDIGQFSRTHGANDSRLIEVTQLPANAFGTLPKLLFVVTPTTPIGSKTPVKEFLLNLDGKPVNAVDLFGLTPDHCD